MKKRNNKTHQCRNSNCNLTYTALTKKSAFCCEDCRMEHGRERRRKRDRAFNLMLKNLKKWYLTLLKFESGSVVDMATLKELGLDPAFLPAGRYNKKGKFVFTLGQVLLTQFHDDLYEITHGIDAVADHTARLTDTKPVVTKPEVISEEKKDEIIISTTTETKDMDEEKKSYNKIIAELQEEVVKLKMESQFKMSRDKIDRTFKLLALIMKPVVQLSELLPFDPKIDSWNGTATIDGAVFKKNFMHQTNYRFVHC